MYTPKAINGAQFKNMLVNASKTDTYTKGYIPKAMKKELRNMTMSNGRKASDVLYKGGMRVERHEALAIIEKLKAKGMAEGVIGHTDKFVREGFVAAKAAATEAAKPKAEEGNPERDEMLKQRHLQERAKEMADEKAAAQAKTSKTKSTKSIRAVHLASGGVAKSGSKTNSGSEFTGNSFGSTNLRSGSSIKSQLPVQQKEDEPLDLAID